MEENKLTFKSSQKKGGQNLLRFSEKNVYVLEFNTTISFFFFNTLGDGDLNQQFRK